jgi:hypothetical protein
MKTIESKVKNAILHDDVEVRTRAVEYFARSFSKDKTVMPLVIQVVERHGRQNAFDYIGVADDLAHTDETAKWLISELNCDPAAKGREVGNYFLHLDRLTANIDVELLQRYQSEIFESPLLSKESAEKIAQRIEMLSWDGAKSWKALEEYCEENRFVDYIGDMDVDRGYYIIEALARDADKYLDRVMEMLSDVNYDFIEDDPYSVMEPLLVRLAGELRLNDAVPYLVERLKIDADYLLEQCDEALVKIGTDEVILRLSTLFPNEEWFTRLYATEPFEHIHSELTIRKCLELLEIEKDRDIKTDLAIALLAQYTPEGIEPVRAMVKARAYSPTTSDLREDIIVMCMTIGETFPEFEKWWELTLKQRIKQKKMMEESEEAFRRDPAGTF